MGVAKVVTLNLIYITLQGLISSQLCFQKYKSPNKLTEKIDKWHRVIFNNKSLLLLIDDHKELEKATDNIASAYRIPL